MCHEFPTKKRFLLSRHTFVLYVFTSGPKIKVSDELVFTRCFVYQLAGTFVSAKVAIAVFDEMRLHSFAESNHKLEHGHVVLV